MFVGNMKFVGVFYIKKIWQQSARNSCFFHVIVPTACTVLVQFQIYVRKSQEKKVSGEKPGNKKVLIF